MPDFEAYVKNENYDKQECSDIIYFVRTGSLTPQSFTSSSGMWQKCTECYKIVSEFYSIQTNYIIIKIYCLGKISFELFSLHRFALNYLRRSRSLHPLSILDPIVEIDFAVETAKGNLSK